MTQSNTVDGPKRDGSVDFGLHFNSEFIGTAMLKAPTWSTSRSLPISVGNLTPLIFAANNSLISLLSAISL